MRYIYLDGLRGVMLISMVLSHLGTNLSLGVTQGLVFKATLINDAASGFVFLSGLSVAIAYANGWFDPAKAARKKALGSRTLRVFTHHVFLVVLVTLAAMAAMALGRSSWITAAYGTAPVLFGGLSVVSLAAGWCMDILPMYVLFLLLTPAAFAAMASGRRWLVIALVAATWGVGQTGFLEASWDGLETALGLEQHAIELGLYFNRLSWSALYFVGLMLGTAFVRGELDLSALTSPRLPPLVLATILFIAASMLLLTLYLFELVTDHRSTYAWLISKRSLGLVSLLNVMATAFVIAWLLVAGPTSHYGSMRMASAGLGRLLRARPLVLLGQHALSIFTFHLVGIYAFYLLVDTDGIEPLGANLILLAGLATLAIPVAYGRHRKARRQQAAATA
ncbi:OpgC domain-containing protein [Devosia aquimaris]|uniref:OpgC domain-containing protein n=1 Tax=Devosia aquimaris TaxID=2866214 RepID=UPI001CD04985|nr:OpgC domain-containing protein [Devosia sp. CJK-A8-3]